MAFIKSLNDVIILDIFRTPHTVTIFSTKAYIL